MSAAKAGSKDIPPKAAQALKDHAEGAVMSRKLIELDAKVPLMRKVA